MPDSGRFEEFADLVRLSTSQILAYINAVLRNSNDTEDLFQETCLVLWQKFEEFKPGTNFLAWALRIADHKIMHFCKKRSRHMAFTASLRDGLMMEIASRGTEVAAASLTALSSCMKHLTPDDRRMITLCHAEGVPARRIADMLGRSPQSVHHSLRRIRSWLLDCIHRELRRAETPAQRPGLLNDEDQP
jgi:RNA polymerase sigma-70 factor, ECF subfamily